MASIAALKIVNYTSALCPKTLPACLFNSSWLSSRKSIPSNFHPTLPQIQKYNIIQRQVANLDLSELSNNKDGSTAQALEVVDVEAKDSVEYIKTLLSTMDDGRISVSPYDTAWIALIQDVNGCDSPQFPSALEWIAQNQLSDGSWGDRHYFCAYDRLVNTLACVVALRWWNVHPTKSRRGISYIKENVHKLENADVEHMTCGFEVVFPSLLQRAQNFGIDDLPYNAPVITEIHSAKERKMKMIPNEVMHKMPTSLLFSLEGLENLDWKKLLKLQSADGSFLTSPSSTAFAFMETGDQNCLRFLTNTLQKLNGGAPHTFPVDVFGRLWAVDRLQRLGISRYFQPEIKDILSYISRCWTKQGVFSGRDSEFCDIDDTSMGFRLLRMHGYDIDPSVFGNFKSGDKFSCYGGQIIESSSPIYNLFRASQFQFPGETILEEARDFAYNFLQEKLTKNQLLDKWVISEHLQDEIKMGLEMPWYATLPRVEASYYLQHYAGGKDVWIGKTLYRMEEISNDTYLELARLDFKRCQEQHKIEWNSMQEWYENCNAQEFGITGNDLLVAYFLAAASIFEPEKANERVGWAKAQIICRMLTSFFHEQTTLSQQKTSLLKEFESSNGLLKLQSAMGYQGLKNVLLTTLHQFLEEFDRYNGQQLKISWGECLKKLQQGKADFWEDAALLATTLNICAGRIDLNEDILSHHEYKTLANLTNEICQQLSHIQNRKALDKEDWRTEKSGINMGIERDMRALVKLVLEESAGGVDRKIKQAFLAVAKTYYYKAYTAPETIDIHMFKVLFDPVV